MRTQKRDPTEDGAIGGLFNALRFYSKQPCGGAGLSTDSRGDLQQALSPPGHRPHILSMLKTRTACVHPPRGGLHPRLTGVVLGLLNH